MSGATVTERHLPRLRLRLRRPHASPCAAAGSHRSSRPVRWRARGSATARCPTASLVGGRAGPARPRRSRRRAELLAERAGRVLVYLGADLTSAGAAGGHRARRSAPRDGGRRHLRRPPRRACSRPSAAAAPPRRSARSATAPTWCSSGRSIPPARYPRYLERYAPPSGHVRRGRLLAVTRRRRPGAARRRRDRVALVGGPGDRRARPCSGAAVLGNRLGELPAAVAAGGGARRTDCSRRGTWRSCTTPSRAASRRATRTAPRGSSRSPQALNGPTRAALSSLRAGGNRSGAEAALTWQTGYPMAVDFASGVPRYAPAPASSGSPRGRIRRGARRRLRRELGGAQAPAAADRRDRPAGERGGFGRAGRDRHRRRRASTRPASAYRMDDVPLPLTPPLSGAARTAAETLDALLAAAVAARAGGRR